MHGSATIVNDHGVSRVSVGQLWAKEEGRAAIERGAYPESTAGDTSVSMRANRMVGLKGGTTVRDPVRCDGVAVVAGT